VKKSIVDRGGKSQNLAADITRIIAEIEKGQFRSLYFFLNSDEVFVQEVIGQLKRKLLVPGLEVFDFETINAADIREEGMNVPVVLQRVRQVPVAAKRRLVVIKNLEKMRANPLKQLLSGLVGLPDSASVVVVAAGDKEFMKLCKGIGLDKFFIILPAPTDEDLKKLLRARVRDAGLEIETPAIDELIAITGDDIMSLKNEIEKMATVLQPGTKISPALVRQYASASRVFNLEDFITAAVMRRRREALRVLRWLEETGEEPVRIVVNLGYALLAMYKVKTGAMPEWAIRPNRRAGLKHWDVNLIDRVLRKLYEINLKIVSGHPEPFALLEMITVAIGKEGG